METVTETKVTYDFPAKYFQIQPEGRIRRYQYLARIIGGGILLWFMVFASFYMLGGIGTSSTLKQGIFLLAVGAGLYMTYILNMKRARDIGNNMEVIKKLLVILALGGALIVAYGRLGEMGMIPGYVSVVVQKLDQLSLIFGEELQHPLPWHQVAMDYLNKIFGLLSFGTFLYLLFVPGKRGDNEYGKDPINTHVSFFG